MLLGEAMLRIHAMTFKGYLQSGFNQLDLLVVVSSWPAVIFESFDVDLGYCLPPLRPLCALCALSVPSACTLRPLCPLCPLSALSSVHHRAYSLCTHSFHILSPLRPLLLLLLLLLSTLRPVVVVVVVAQHSEACCCCCCCCSAL